MADAQKVQAIFDFRNASGSLSVSSDSVYKLFQKGLDKCKEMCYDMKQKCNEGKKSLRQAFTESCRLLEDSSASEVIAPP